MGRPRNGVPYLKKGKYHVRFQGDTMSTDLGTTSASVAKSRVSEVVRLRDRRGQSSNVSAPIVSQPVQPSVSPSTGAAPRTSDALGDWYDTESEFANIESPKPILGTDTQPETGSTGDRAEVLPVPQGGTPGALRPSGLSWESPKPGLSSADKEKLHGLMAGVVGRLNVLGVGLAVHVFGRVPAEPEPADMELLNKAWALQLNEWFSDKEIKPAILIAAASVGLGVGMFVNGTPKPPKVKIATENNDGTRAK